MLYRRRNQALFVATAALISALAISCSSGPTKKREGRRSAKAVAIGASRGIASTQPEPEGDAREVEELRTEFAKPPVIESFFNNYGLLAQGFEAFRQEQAKLLSPELVTIVRDHHGETSFKGPEGYFESLGPWSQSFSTGEDFGTRYDGKSPSGWHRVKMTGTLTLKLGGKEIKLEGDRNGWEELFKIDERTGLISELIVDMHVPGDALK